ncbi:MAG TPA: ABC transporter substrate-binding protein [Paucimonas sp.]|nr:ABC transporter substrate-binding protein [Paucimonas sp.]
MKRSVPLKFLLACFLFGLLAQTSAATSETSEKVLRYVFPESETGFDPAVSYDWYSAQVIQSIFESLYTFDYLARPVRLVPQTAQALPVITNQGKTYTIALKKGIYFSADPAFGGKPRELTATDYAYSFKRLLDPRIKSPHAWLFEEKIVGLDELARDAKASGRFEYDRQIAGLEIVDRYTLRIHLKHADFNFGQILAHFPSGAVAREVVERYRNNLGRADANPVGTGPYRLAQWRRGSRIVLDANPVYRGFTWNFQLGSDPEDRRIVAQMSGKRMPQIKRIEINVIAEDQARWLSFQNDEVDLFQLYGPLTERALKGGKLVPELVQKGVQLSRIADPELGYYYWNMRDPIVGGLSKDKIALRRAIAMAYDVKEEIRQVWNGEATPLAFPVPPGVVGHDGDYQSMIRFDPAAANLLLDRFSYKKGRDGWRTMPDGRPLQIRYSAPTTSLGRLQAELWKKAFDSIGIRMTADFRPPAELLTATKQCQLQMRTALWSADYPDGDNFMQIFYGPNIGKSNNGCSRIPEYDALYARTRNMMEGPERKALYRKMARILEVNTVQFLGFARYNNMLAQARVIGYKKHPILAAEWMYCDIEQPQKE